jgi:hypothetical protein
VHYALCQMLCMHYCSELLKHGPHEVDDAVLYWTDALRAQTTTKQPEEFALCHFQVSSCF